MTFYLSFPTLTNFQESPHFLRFLGYAVNSVELTKVITTVSSAGVTTPVIAEGEEEEGEGEEDGGKVSNEVINAIDSSVEKLGAEVAPPLLHDLI